MWGHSASSKFKIRILFVSSYFNEIIEENLEAVKKSLNFKFVPTYPCILSIIWLSIPMFWTCKNLLSILSAHQIWAWYLKPHQKKVGCQNYCGLWDTWCSEYWYIPPGKHPHSSTLMKCNAEFNPKRVVQCSNNCWSFGYLPKHRLFAGASAYCRSLGKCRILQISTDSASAEASAG